MAARIDPTSLRLKPILLSSHNRSITYVRYSPDGQLLFSMSKDGVPTVWDASTGERIGTYEGGPYEKWRDWRNDVARTGSKPEGDDVWVGHGGAVWHCDVTADATRLVTAAAPNTAIMWNVETGRPLHRWEFGGAARCVALDEGENRIAIVSDKFGQNYPVTLHVFPFSKDPAQCGAEAIWTWSDPERPRMLLTKVLWAPMNLAIFAATDNGSLIVFDADNGGIIAEIEGAHKHKIMDMQMNKEKTLLTTCSHDESSKLWDIETLLRNGDDDPLVRVYKTDGPLNACAISPLALRAEDPVEHVIMGGGQEARDVTTTASSQGKFEARIHHLIFQEELAQIKGHFGPINTIAYHPSGQTFASGGEDGYVRIHPLPEGYFELGRHRELDDEAVSVGMEAGKQAHDADEDEETQKRIAVEAALAVLTQQSQAMSRVDLDAVAQESPTATATAGAGN